MESYTVFPYGFTTSLELPGLTFRSVREEPFDLYGLYEPRTPGLFRRMPEEAAQAASSNVLGLSAHPAGGRIRFVTDSSYVALHAVLPSVCHERDFAAGAGFDLYVRVGSRFLYYANMPPALRDDASSTEFERAVTFPAREKREILIHFPLYSSVRDVYIGTEEGSLLEHGGAYRFPRPVVYYGSSITQGMKASRPGNTYEALISRDLDCDFLNLGFSGSALGEAAMSAYIASLDMSVFVLDYDFNAPTPEHLRATHEPFFRAVRAAHPTLPVIMVSRPNTYHAWHSAEAARQIDACRTVIEETYLNARRAGDRFVRFIDGDSLFDGPHFDSCTVDRTHPNDAGFFRMAEKIGASVSAVLR